MNLKNILNFSKQFVNFVKKSNYDDDEDNYDLEIALEQFQKDYLSDYSFDELEELKRNLQKEIDEILEFEREKSQYQEEPRVPYFLERKMKLVDKAIKDFWPND